MRPDLEDTEFDIIDFIEDIDDECECLLFFYLISNALVILHYGF